MKEKYICCNQCDVFQGCPHHTLCLRNKVAFRFREIIKCVEKERWKSLYLLSYLPVQWVFVRLSSKERWMESQQVFSLWLMRTCLLFVILLLRIWNFHQSWKHKLWRANFKWNETEMNFVFRSGRCVNICRSRHDCVLKNFLLFHKYFTSGWQVSIYGNILQENAIL